MIIIYFPFYSVHELRLLGILILETVENIIFPNSRAALSQIRYTEFIFLTTNNRVP